MIGVIVNALGVFFGGLIGYFFGKKINKNVGIGVTKAIGIAVLIIGLAGLLKSMLFIDMNGSLSSRYELEMLIFLSVGTIIGEFLKIDLKLNKFGMFVEKKLDKGAFSKGFINSSLVTCIGAMAILGSISAAIEGDNTILYTKSAIDFVTCIILGSTLGFGVMFSAIPVFIYQSLFYLLGLILSNSFTSQEFLDVFCIVGYAIVMCISLNFVFEKNTVEEYNDLRRIKVANMLPSLILVIIYYIIKGLFI